MVAVPVPETPPFWKCELHFAKPGGSVKTQAQVPRELKK
jgi:hypothetical protein